ncbi:hypothetical protein PVL29_026395 [Vitis rotundifolia]|uniref:Uncharacterized protein n=1 Tax=Vitis rotundifolia TaxID=103349 RepID=A0AA38YMB1_VITRO|nr:hypothetical protein PVL29_026395 [Vitis rotundifolia]
MAPKRALAEASSNASEGKSLEVARMIETKGKILDVPKTSDNKQKTPEVRKKATFDRATFTTPELAQRFNLHFANQTVIPGRNIDFAKLSFFQFDKFFTRMDWLPIVSMKEFIYPRWPRVEGFKPAEAIQRLCGYQKSGRPTSHSLTMLSCILQHMISYIFILKGGHRDDVSFLEAFLVDNILIKRNINMGYIIFRHMKACSFSEDSVLPYSMFITKIVKYFNVNLRNETEGKKLKSFDTYDRVSLRHMHFEKEYENQDVEKRGSENANVIEILSNDGVRAMAVADHPSQIGRNEAEASDNLNAQISSIGTHLKEMVLANDRRLTSLEQRIDGFQEEFKVGMQVIRAQYDELMVFL